jgi:hypothetical protein
MNDFIMNMNVCRSKGFLEAESRLWYEIHFQKRFKLRASVGLAMSPCRYNDICGFLTLGAGIQNLNTAALIMGWGISLVAVTFNTVAM